MARSHTSGKTTSQGADHGALAVIPAKSNRRTPIPYDREKYRWRNLVERLFGKLKNWRRIATRYDKTWKSYLGFVAVYNSGRRSKTLKGLAPYEFFCKFWTSESERF
jgi:transposase